MNTSSLKVLVTGSERGQLYWELMRTLPQDISLCQPDLRLDITDADSVQRALRTFRPDAVINAAAYTAVDKAESEPDVAHRVNAEGVSNLVDAAMDVGARFLQVSTDFVFGQVPPRPVPVDAKVGPVSVYGQSKLAGERIVQERAGEQGMVMRTAWVHSSHGNNFVKTMLRLMNERDEIGVVADQIGSPTWANSLARALWRSVQHPVTGIHHWTGAGVASWYDFAMAIYEEGTALGLIASPCRIRPLRTEDYPTPAARPAYSVLDLTHTWAALDMHAEHWRVDLRTMLREL